MFISKKKYKELTDKIESIQGKLDNTIEKYDKEIEYLNNVNIVNKFKNKYPNGYVSKDTKPWLFGNKEIINYKYIGYDKNHIYTIIDIVLSEEISASDKEFQYKIIDKSPFVFIQIKYKDDDKTNTYIVDKKNRTANEYNKDDFKVNFDKIEWAE